MGSSAISDLGMGDEELPPANRSPGLSIQNFGNLGSEDKVLKVMSKGFQGISLRVTCWLIL